MDKYIIEKAIDGFAVWAAGADRRIGMPLSFHNTQRDAERQVKLFKATDNRREGRSE